MKKTWISLMMLLCLVLVVVACGGNQSNNTSSNNQGNNEQSNSGNNSGPDVAEADNSPVNSNIIGGRVGGAWSLFTEGVAESIRRTYDGSIVTVEPGGLIENAPAVGSGQIDFGMVQALTAFQAFNGTEPYENNKFEDLRGAFVIIPDNAFQLVARADAKFNSIEDIVENQMAVRLVLDSKGSLGEIMFRNILKAYGVTYDDIISWGGTVDHLGGGQSFELMRDNRADLTGDAIPVPDGDILEASSTMDLKMISMNDEYIEVVVNELGLYATTIPAGSYDFQAEDIKTVSTPTIVVTNKDVAEETVYKAAKAVYENLEYLGTVHNELTKLTKEKLANVGVIPLHPGAEKFYKEVGLIQ